MTDYPCPAGGCLLTDPEFAARFRDLLEHEPDFGLPEARLLLHGRHFRLPGGTKVIVGRDESDNAAIESGAGDNDALLVPKDAPGPTALCCKSGNVEDILLAAGLVARYTTKRGPTLDVEIARSPVDLPSTAFRNVRPLSRDTVAQWHVGTTRAKSLAGAQT